MSCVYTRYDLFHLIATYARERNQVSPSDIRSNWDTESLNDLFKVTQLVNDRTKLRPGSFEPCISTISIIPGSFILFPTSKTCYLLDNH